MNPDFYCDEDRRAYHAWCEHIRERSAPLRLVIKSEAVEARYEQIRQRFLTPAVS